jgi:outer membrane protein TolC
MGAISQVDLLSFRTRAAELEESVVSAELGREQRSITLSQLMGGTLASDLYAATDPGLPGNAFDQKAIAAAMASDSVELAELEQQVELARTRAAVAGETWRPRLDLEAWAQTSGESTGFPRAWARAGQGEYWSAHGGIVFDVPLDNSAKHAEQMQAQLAVQSAEQLLRAARTRIGSDATAAIASQRAAAARLQSAERTTTIAEQTYRAERERYQLGQTIVIQVQQAEDAFRRARLREARARVDAAQAGLILQHLTGQLLAGR